MELIRLERDGARAVLYPEAPSHEGVETAAVGQFKCSSPEAGALVLGDAVQAARAAGRAALIGPMDGNTWNAYRVRTWSDGCPDFFLEPQSGEHDLDAFRAAGFEEVAHYVSTRAPVGKAADDTAPNVSGVTIRNWSGEDAEALFADIHALSCRSFAGNAYYTEIGREAFLAMYVPLVPGIDPRFVFEARDEGGALVGFLFGLPDPMTGAKTRIILKTYASERRGVGRALAHAFHVAAETAGFEEVLHALMHESNLSRDNSALHGAEVFRRYALMGRRLD